MTLGAFQCLLQGDKVGGTSRRLRDGVVHTMFELLVRIDHGLQPFNLWDIPVQFRFDPRSDQDCRAMAN